MRKLALRSRIKVEWLIINSVRDFRGEQGFRRGLGFRPVSHTLILLRHGQSTWNQLNLFTGWYDADLSEQGVAEGRAAGRTLLEEGVEPDVVHTSRQVRAIRTADLALDELGRLWLPVRRSWRLNERHYGDLQGKDKKQIAEEVGAEQFKVWRRSYDVPPPPLDRDDERHSRFDPRYADLAPDLIPATECLADVVVRVLPYWYDDIVPDLAAGRTVLVAAHGNSLRALIKHLDHISDDDIAELNLPTGVPIRYELGDDFAPIDQVPIDARYLGDAEAARAAAEAVARQGQAPAS
jgi:2,3-bisphosphoglycerate-dependent phosphoglycerate mutase